MNEQVCIHKTFKKLNLLQNRVFNDITFQLTEDNGSKGILD